VRSRAQLEQEIMVQREEIAIHEAKARNALKQGRQDLAREALRWKACHE
jgi:phage shock protein A